MKKLNESVPLLGKSFILHLKGIGFEKYIPTYSGIAHFTLHAY